MKAAKYSMGFIIISTLIVYGIFFSFDENFLETILQSVLISTIFAFITAFIIEKAQSKDKQLADEQFFFEVATPNIRNIIHHGATLIMAIYENKNDFRITHVNVLLPVLEEINLAIELADRGFDEDFMHELRIRIYSGQPMLNQVEIDQDMIENLISEAYEFIKEIDDYLMIYSSLAPKTHIKKVLELKAHIAMISVIGAKLPHDKYNGHIYSMRYLRKIINIILSIEKERSEKYKDSSLDSLFE